MKTAMSKLKKIHPMLIFALGIMVGALAIGFLFHYRSVSTKGLGTSVLDFDSALSSSAITTDFSVVDSSVIVAPPLVAPVDYAALDSSVVAASLYEAAPAAPCTTGSTVDTTATDSFVPSFDSLTELPPPPGI